MIFLADLSRAIPILHGLDFIELAGYGSAQMGGHEQIRVLKDLDADIRDRDVIVVEDVIEAVGSRESPVASPDMVLGA